MESAMHTEARNAHHARLSNVINFAVATPLHQLVNMPATNDGRTFEHLAKYLTGFFAAFGILQRVKSVLKNASEQG